MSQLPINDLELSGVREDVEQVFKDEGKVERITSIGTLDHSTAELIEETRVLIYEGRCSLYPIVARRDRFDEFGQGLVFTRQYRLVLPYTVDNVQIRDRFTLTVSNDPQGIGREMEVRDVMVSTLLGFRRITVQDTTE